MCDVIAVAAAGVAVSAGGAVASYSAQNSAAGAQRAYNNQVMIQQASDRAVAMHYQNEVWEQDIAYSKDMLAWAETEFERQTRYVDRAAAAIEKNTIAATGQLLLRQVEEDIAVIAQSIDTRTRGSQVRGALAARDRGVEGNSVEAIVNDVMRQEGEVLNVMAMNRSASLRAINRQIIEADVQGDQQLANLALKTYAPSQQIRSPAPINSVMPAAPVQGGNVGQLVTGLAGAVTSGFNNYSAMSGLPLDKTVSQAGNWLSRQFQVNP
jgi:uncharacterized protein YeaO (DUF488 family)